MDWLAAQRLARLLATIAMALLVGAMIPSGSTLAQDDAAGVTVTLNEVDDSGVSGSATLTPDGDQTHVDMTLDGPGVVGNHPTHIHTGTCTNFDPNPLYPLETVLLEPVSDEGKSVSTVDVPLDELQGGDYVILVHLSPEELTTYLVCGEIPQEAVGGQAATATESMTIPASGTGAAADRPGAFGIAAGLGVAAGLLLSAGIFLRRQFR